MTGVMLCAVVAVAGGHTTGRPFEGGPDGWSLSQGGVPHTFIQPQGKFKIYQGRPRLLIRDTDMPWLKARIAGDLKPTWDFIIKEASGRNGIGGKPRIDTPKNWAWSTQYPAIAGLVTGEKKYVDYCIDWALAMAAKSPWQDAAQGSPKKPINDTSLLTRVECMAYMYDWFYDKFTPEDRKKLRDGLVEHIKVLRWHPVVADISPISGCERGAVTSLGAGLIALYPDFQDAEILNFTRKRIVEMYAAEAMIGRGGGFYVGWGGFMINDGYLAWTTGTNDVLWDDWQSDLTWWEIYGMRGDGFYPPMSDAKTGMRIMNIRSHATLSAEGLMKNPYSRWFYEQKGYGGQKDYKWLLKLLLWDESVQPKPPDDLPLSRAFGGCGNVICRDRWDERTTHFVFRSVPFAGGIHRHMDQNSFVIHYRGELALDSGKAGEVEDEYRLNSLAHNCMYFHDASGKLNPRDGMQKQYPPGQGRKRTLEQIKPGGDSDVRGLFRFQDAPDWTYAAGEATKFYDARLVKLSQREVVYIRKSDWPHPIVVVFDRNNTSGPHVEPRFLLHTVHEPRIDGGLITAVHEGGKVYVRPVAPAQARIEPIGGPGKEAWMFDRNYGTGKRVTKGVQVNGNWRVEISASKAEQASYMLHVFYVTDADDTTPPPQALAIDSDTVVGVETAGWTVVFCKPEQAASIGYAVPDGSSGKSRHLVAGLPAGSIVAVSVDGKQPKPAGSDEPSQTDGACVEFVTEAPPGATVTVKEQPPK